METTLQTNEPLREVTAVINLLPVGTILPYGGTAERISTMQGQGWMLCNGAKLNKAQYPLLFDVIGNTCGGADPEFCLPDLRGVFLRGVDGEGAASRDPDNASRKRQGTDVSVPNGRLTYQDEDFKKHTHGFPERAHAYAVFRSPGDGGYHFNAIEPKAGTSDEKGGNETRPKNVSVNYIIFAGLPVS
ncbi:phage tail protein [Mucilaginibacter pedocola]|uniref:Phage tail collar domain-containing protein n=1 Tax=Mucilaginibacter pedocola TaxID=1792845 RepID=A0A1S9PG44_9SPHI|nr:phage tail protein [Mucilaginibacter pedocola]OOQ59955.1 hypothetical protein BC343_27780 [Mucilaginibacter pedocola]